MVEVLRIAFEQGGRRQFGLLNVQILRLLKLQQGADVVSLRRVNDDDALALFELPDQMVSVQRGQHRDGDGDEKPEPRQTITLREKLCWVETLSSNVGGSRTVAGRSLARIKFSGCHKTSVVVAFALGDEFADGFVPGDVVTGTAASGARGQTRTSDDDGPGAAETSGCRQSAERSGQARCASGDQRHAGGRADGGGASGGGGSLEKTADRARNELAASKRAVIQNLLDDDRAGKRAEHNPKGNHENPD